jgi:hypothetical protein
MKRRRQIMRAAALGAILLLGFADAGARTERVRPYEFAGPAGLGIDEPLCRRLAAALNAEGPRELTAPRTDSMFLRWEPYAEFAWPEPEIIQAVRADILNEGIGRKIYRTTSLFSPRDPSQALVFMRDDGDPLPPHEKAGPSIWAEAVRSGRMIVVELLFRDSIDSPPNNVLRHFPPFHSAAGRRFFLSAWDAMDLVLSDDQRVMVLFQDTRSRVALLFEMRAWRAQPICYLS